MNGQKIYIAKNTYLPNRLIQARAVILLCLLFCHLIDAVAATHYVKDTESLRSAIISASSGDGIYLASGIYVGNFVINKSLTISGKKGAIIDAGNRGNALTITASNAAIENLTIKRWGNNLTDLNSGIFVSRDARCVTIRHNILRGASFGVWVDAAANVTIQDNTIIGDMNVRSQDRGNGIHLYAVTGAFVKDNEVFHTRDGIYIDTSDRNVLSGNYLHDLRYGIHYMYSHENLIKKNTTTNTRTGYALMQSQRLEVIDNKSLNDQNYGILMNFITYSTLDGNVIAGVQAGRSPTSKNRSDRISGAEGKSIFIYNSVFNTISYNAFNESDIGIHLTAGSEDNAIYGNSFIRNKEQVKYVSSREQEWSQNGHGNFWSDYLGWDLDNDGIGDSYYEPNDGVDKILWKYPSAKVLINSPAVEVLRWVQREFPVFVSPGVKDSSPLMHSPPPKKHLKEHETTGKTPIKYERILQCS